MGINFKSSFSAAKHSQRITQEKKQKLDIAMQDAKKQILVRTGKGQGAEGELAEYSEGYEAYKKRRTGKTTVTLRESGNMLTSMQATTELNENGIEGKITFSQSEGKKAFWNQQLRPNWFKLSANQITQILRKLKGK